MPIRNLLALMLVAVIGVGAASPRACAQDGQLLGGTPMEIELKVARFGVGGASRAGSWCGVLVNVRDLGLNGRNVILRVEGADPDGDRPLFDRAITTNPGVGRGVQSFWLYTRLPYRFTSGSALTITAYEAIDTGGQDASVGRLGYRAGRLLGRTLASTNGVRPATDELTAIVGPVDFGLKAYAIGAQGKRDYPAKMHELDWGISGITSGDLPDRWQGLAPFGTLVWGRSSGQADPGALRIEQARAIERWVERGGHLVVVMPSAGQEWISQGSNRLLRLLPKMNPPTRREGVDLTAYRPILTSNRGAILPGSAVVHEFVAADDAGAGEAIEVLNGPDGACIVMRRLVGTGMVSVVGIDLGAGSMRAGGLPRAEHFWHRVLGRRGQIVYTNDPGAKAFDKPREQRQFDDDLGDEIARSGKAIQGVLLGLIVFGLYWVLAGPGGFALLGKWKLKHHSWMAFIAAAGLFTGIAWTGAMIMRPKRADATHLTLMEQVEGQGLVRARSWISVMIPRYGEAALSVGDGGESTLGGSTALLSAWTPPGTDPGAAQAFPDNRGYRVDARAPSAMRVPVRSTIKQIEVEWAGASPWDSIQAVGEPGRAQELSFARSGSVEYVRGGLAHALPGELERVTIIVVFTQHSIRRAAPGDRLISNARAYTLKDAWAPDTLLKLDELTQTEVGKADISKYLDRLLRSGKKVMGTPGSGSMGERLTAVRLLSQFPPAFGVTDSKNDRLARRVATHGFDLGKWFTQPCVIVIGHLRTNPGDKAPGPVPLGVDGKLVPMSGRTVLAWVYPMPGGPPAWNITPSKTEVETKEKTTED